MKDFASRFFLILFLITVSVFTGTLNADHYRSDYRNEQQDCCQPSDCCRSSCYECSCNPLYCGALDLQFHVGIAPMIWRNRGLINAVSCPSTVGAPGGSAIFPLFQIPKFSTFYHAPWLIGGQLGYAISDNIRVYLEINYLQSRGKKDVALVSTTNISTAAATSNTFTFTLEKYRLVDAYIGARYYFDRWCDRTSFFLGFKAGLTHHKRVRFAAAFTAPQPPAPQVVVAESANVLFFHRNTVPSGGVNFGLDFCFCGNWSLVLTGEIVASCGPKNNKNIAFGQSGAGCGAVLGPQPVLPLVPFLSLNNLLIGGIGTELRFPITAAVRYSF